MIKFLEKNQRVRTKKNFLKTLLIASIGFSSAAVRGQAPPSVLPTPRSTPTPSPTSSVSSSLIVPQNHVVTRFKLSDLIDDVSLTGLSKDSLQDQKAAEKYGNTYRHTRRSRSSRKGGVSVGRKLSRRQVAALVSRMVRTHHLESLDGANDRELIHFFAKERSIQKLKPLINEALGAGSCPSAALLSSLGARVEVEFPAEEYKTLAASLYQKALTCPASIAVFHAAYRLGLIEIWNGHCDRAEVALSQVPDSPDSSEYRMRASYWRYYCADQAKNEVLKGEMRKSLVRQYPLSLHSLMADSDLARKFLSSPELIEPMVSARTRQNPELNRIVGAVEYLLRKGNKGLASVILMDHLSDAQAAEMEFQIYWSVLLSRADNKPASFQLMATLFRENPQLLSRSALQLMYPIKQLELVRSAPSLVDPFMVLSVMRQESAFNERAVSSAGARGLMQIQIATARNFERVSRLQLAIPTVNIRIGVRYINRLLARYSGGVEFALAAYNAGPGRITEWNARYPVENRLLFLDFIPFKETREYVSSILRNYYWYLKLYPNASAMRPALLDGAHVFKSPILDLFSIQRASTEGTLDSVVSSKKVVELKKIN